MNDPNLSVDEEAPTQVFVRPATPISHAGIAIASAITRLTPDLKTTDFEHLPAVLTTREAASALRIGVRELRNLVDTGQIPAARFGPRRVIRIAKSTLLGVLRGSRRPTT